jgi:hypothetical protein
MNLANSTPLPPQVFDDHSAVLGKTGAGKTTTVKGMVEHVVVEHDARVCIIDPIKSDYWGLTSAADGKRAGLPFQILGGPRGHVPLHEASGKAIGELVASGALPLSILDMADFGPGGLQRFFTDFASALFKSIDGVVYLVVDEAHEFAPKERAGFSGENMALHWFKKLATGGRSKGIRLVVASQRVQALHNAILGSCETMIAHRFTTPADQKPILDWIRGNAGKETMDIVAGKIASFPNGSGWVVSGAAELNQLMEFPKAATFDSGKTPAIKSAKSDVVTSAIDVDALRKVIGSAVAEAEANDPKALRAKIVELEKRLKAQPAAGPSAAELNEARVAVWEDGCEHGQQQERKRWLDAGKSIERCLNEIRAQATAAGMTLVAAMDLPHGGSADAAQPVEHRASIPKVAGSMPVVRSNPPVGAPKQHDGINGPQQRILDALAELTSVAVNAPQRTIVANFSGYSNVKSTGFAKALSGLSASGLVRYPDPGTVSLTDEGAALANWPGQLLTSADLHNRILGMLSGPGRLILQELINRYPNPMSREDLATATGYQNQKSTGFAKALSRLSALGFIGYPSPGQAVALPVCFLEGR